MSDASTQAGPHRFTRQPHRTLLALSLPILISLIAEPLTGMADTAFVARLGSTSLAALGVATMLLSSVFWVFNFLGIGTQTEVATSLGAGNREAAREALGVAITLGVALGVSLAAVAWPLLETAASAMGADGEMNTAAVAYLKIRLFGGPATLAMMACFGALRGIQDMRTPLWVALGSNALNIVLDPLLIFGLGPFPELGIAGAAWASTAAAWLAALWAAAACLRKIGMPGRVRLREALQLLVVGRDLFARTGLLLLFVLLATRAATRAGAEAGAAHQVVRQVWLLLALVLDAYAHAAQSLVGFFMGARKIREARRVAVVASQWAVGTGVVLTLAMMACQPFVAALLVPPDARAVFAAPWLVLALAQPLSAISFVSDGIHWGTGDYRFLRNAMFLSTSLGVAALYWVDVDSSRALVYIWLITFGWVSIRSLFGLIRIWPGIGNAPLALLRES